MSSTSNLNRKETMIDNGNDSIVIINDLGDIPGGRTLEVSGLDASVKVIRAGHVLRRHKTTKAISPLPVSNGNYTAVGDAYEYIGVLKCSVLVSDPRAAILTIGQVNAAASPYPVTDTIKSGLPNIQFV